MSLDYQSYLSAFIPIFVAVDAIGNLPVFISLVGNLSNKQKRKIIVQSVTTATIMAIAFVFFGKWVLSFLSITIPDFQIAGGIFLFVIAARFLFHGTQKSVIVSPQDKDIGVFPLGTPFITGPAVLTTTLMMRDHYGLLPTFVSLVLNMLFVWFTLVKANMIIKLIGEAGTRAFSKIMYILLGAIAVMMVRKGIMGVFAL